ncbi:Uncharacterized protein OBRU01_18442 [Operophtera brumata]|uniref:Uncharacterized protein n=1 Tax=Operophtera brumata TaxID=104452 RepID=A0A0L7KZC2_OPEBR|nr:Uncharacterized protein OBRU01_18442 [Operophtera brumata]
MQAVDSDTDSMSNKRKSGDDVPDGEAKAKRRRRRERSRSEPRNTGSDNAQKREALHRLFGRYSPQGNPHFDTDDEDLLTESDESDDPCYIEDPLLLDAVPECMDPEQLGFLLCAQETLRFLRQSGMSFRNPVYVNLRSRFLKAMKDLGIA